MIAYHRNRFWRQAATPATTRLKQWIAEYVRRPYHKQKKGQGEK